MWFPSVPGLFTEIKLCSIPSPIQQPQEIPVTSSRHKLKNNHPPATETSVLPTSINTHITSATYIHILLCLCPISMLDSEILIFYYLLLSSSFFSRLNETPESKREHLPMLQTSSEMKQLMTAVKFSSCSHSPNQHKLIRAGPGLKSLNRQNVITRNFMALKKSGTSPRFGIFASSLHKFSFHPNTRYYHKPLEKCLLN